MNMVTKTQALKVLYEAVGGNLTDVADASTVTEMLNAIATQMGSEEPPASNTVKAILNIAEAMDNMEGGGGFSGELYPFEPGTGDNTGQ